MYKYTVVIYFFFFEWYIRYFLQFKNLIGILSFVIGIMITLFLQSSSTRENELLLCSTCNILGQMLVRPFVSN